MACLDAAVAALAWSRDGAWLAASTTSGRVAVLDTRSWRVVASRPVPAAGELAWAPDGRELAAVSQFLDVRFLDPEDLAERACLRVGWTDDEAGSDGQPAMGIVSDLAYSPAGESVAFALSDHRLTLYDRARRAEAWRRAARASSPLVCFLSFDPSGQQLALNEGHSLCLIDLATRAERTGPAAAAPVGAVSWSPDGRRIAIEVEGGITLMDARTLKPCSRLTAGGGGRRRPVWRSDGERIGLAAAGAFEVWDTHACRQVARAAVVGAGVLSAAADPRSLRFAYGCADGTIGCLEG